jgi:hypothetical protein
MESYGNWLKSNIINVLKEVRRNCTSRMCKGVFLKHLEEEGHRYERVELQTVLTT